MVGVTCWKRPHPLGRPVEQICAQTRKVIQVLPSVREAERLLDITQIQRACLQGTKAGGFFFRFMAQPQRGSPPPMITATSEQCNGFPAEPRAEAATSPSDGQQASAEAAQHIANSVAAAQQRQSLRHCANHTIVAQRRLSAEYSPNSLAQHRQSVEERDCSVDARNYRQCAECSPNSVAAAQHRRCAERSSKSDAAVQHKPSAERSPNSVAADTHRQAVEHSATSVDAAQPRQTAHCSDNPIAADQRWQTAQGSANSVDVAQHWQTALHSTATTAAPPRRQSAEACNTGRPEEQAASIATTLPRCSITNSVAEVAARVDLAAVPYLEPLQAEAGLPAPVPLPAKPPAVAQIWPWRPASMWAKQDQEKNTVDLREDDGDEVDIVRVVDCVDLRAAEALGPFDIMFSQMSLDERIAAARALLRKMESASQLPTSPEVISTGDQHRQAACPRAAKNGPLVTAPSARHPARQHDASPARKRRRVEEPRATPPGKRHKVPGARSGPGR